MIQQGEGLFWIIVPDELTAYDSGVLPTPNEITDHFATYIVLPHDYSVSSAYTRVWFYKRANFTQLENNIRSFGWECPCDGTVNDCCALFTKKKYGLCKRNYTTKKCGYKAQRQTMVRLGNPKMFEKTRPPEKKSRCSLIGLSIKIFVIK